MSTATHCPPTTRMSPWPAPVPRSCLDVLSQARLTIRRGAHRLSDEAGSTLTDASASSREIRQAPAIVIRRRRPSYPRPSDATPTPVAVEKDRGVGTPDLGPLCPPDHRPGASRFLPDLTSGRVALLPTARAGVGSAKRIEAGSYAQRSPAEPDSKEIARFPVKPSAATCI